MKFLKFSPGHSLRILIGVGLLGLAAISYIPYLFFTYSTNAVVTGHLVTVTAPIDGVITKAPPPIGTELRKDEVIATIENPIVDQHALNNLETEQRALNERIKALTREKDSLEDLHLELDRNHELYQDYMQTRIGHDIDRAEYRKQELSDSVKQSKNQLGRERTLFSKNYSSQSKLDDAFYTTEKSGKAVAQAQSELDRLLSDLKALESGVYIAQDGQTPFQQKQQMDELTIRMTALDTQIQELSAKLEGVNAHYLSEQNRINQLTKADVSSQGHMVVWRTIVNQGNHVDAKTAVVEMVDCSNVFIEMTLPERYFEKIKPGDEASVTLTGAYNSIQGTVVAVRGRSIHPDNQASFVGVPPVLQAREISIMIAINQSDLGSVEGNFCHVGRTAEVSFKGSFL